MVQTVLLLAEALSRSMEVPLAMTEYVEPGLIMYLPISHICDDGKKRLPGVYVHPGAGTRAIGGGVVFSNNG